MYRRPSPLIVLLVAGAQLAPGRAAAAEPARLPPAAAAVPAPFECDAGGCRQDSRTLLQVRSRGERAPLTRGTSDRSSSPVLQPDRRVSVQAQHPGKVIASGQWSLDLPGGGAIWASEDPAMGAPEFNVAAPALVPLADGRIVGPVRFFTYCNYVAFIERAEIVIFRATDTDLVAPLARIAVRPGAAAQTEWDGALPAATRLRAGDELVYVARAYDAAGHLDETAPRRLRLASAGEVERGLERMRGDLEKRTGTASSKEDAQRQSLIEATFGGDGLARQTIALRGSRVRIQGLDLPPGYALSIDGRPHPIDLERKFVAEYLVPPGPRAFALELSGDGLPPIRRALELEVSGRYLFATAMADFTYSKGSVSGSTRTLDSDERYRKDELLEGRLAFYLKAKFEGRYLLTAQADTRERELAHLFDGFFQADPRDVFRRLDPDEYYPSYGDDSVTYRDIDTQGRLYLRLDWDRSQAVWGNFDTGFSGTEYGRYSRALYGAALQWNSLADTPWGEARSQWRAFGSQAQSLPGHTELLGYNGSVYALKHTDLLPGSDRVVLEVRDRSTGRVMRRTPLAAGADYELDAFQGRLLLSRALAQISREGMPTLTRDAPLDGYDQVLVVDYEYVPDGFDSDAVSAGVRGKQWFGEHLALGATWVEEDRAGEDYTLRGADLTLQAGRGTWLKLERHRSRAQAAPIWFSGNGGFSFQRLNPAIERSAGEAEAAEARINLKELGWTRSDWSAGAWHRRADAGFSIGRFDNGLRTQESGAEFNGRIGGAFELYGRYSQAERGDDALRQGQLTARWHLSPETSLGAELRRVREARGVEAGTGTLAALEYRQRLRDALELYGIVQRTLDDDHGAYADNDAQILGLQYEFGEASTLGAEASHGDRGDAVRLQAEHRLAPDHSIYGAYTFARDALEHDPLFDQRSTPGWTMGQRWRLSDRTNLFNESQFLKAPGESAIAHTFGMDFYPLAGWNLGFSLQDGDLEGADGNVERKAVSLNGGRSSPDTQWQSRLEWRRDRGAERRRQWASTHRLSHKLNDDWRIAARLNYSDTRDRNDRLAGARFAEANLGLAWRPADTARYALFGKYTYLYDVSTLEQIGDGAAYYDQRSQILALEGVYHPNGRWEYAAKLMWRKGEVRMGRLQGRWIDATARFAALQARYELHRQWHGLLEYRWLGVNDGSDLGGVLVGLDRDLGQNFRVGVGYSFARFSDDLTDFDYDRRGFFLNVNGRY